MCIHGCSLCHMPIFSTLTSLHFYLLCFLLSRHLKLEFVIYLLCHCNFDVMVHFVWLNCSIRMWTCCFFLISMVSSTYLFQTSSLAVNGAVNMAFYLKFSKNRSQFLGATGPPIAAPNLCLWKIHLAVRDRILTIRWWHITSDEAYRQYRNENINGNQMFVFVFKRTLYRIVYQTDENLLMPNPIWYSWKGLGQWPLVQLFLYWF